MIIYAVENSSKGHTDNTEEYMLVLVEVLADALDGITVTVDAKHSVNITKSKKIIFDSALKCSQNFFACFCMLIVYKCIHLKQMILK